MAVGITIKCVTCGEICDSERMSHHFCDPKKAERKSARDNWNIYTVEEKLDYLKSRIEEIANTLKKVSYNREY